MYQNGAINSILTSISKQPNVFKLPAYSLQTLTTYVFKVNVVDVLSGLSSFDKVTVTVQQSALKALIAGGSQFTVPLGQMVTLDGSSSVNQDSPGNVTQIERTLVYNL